MILWMLKRKLCLNTSSERHIPVGEAEAFEGDSRRRRSEGRVALRRILARLARRNHRGELLCLYIFQNSNVIPLRVEIFSFFMYFNSLEQGGL